MSLTLVKGLLSQQTTQELTIYFEEILASKEFPVWCPNAPLLLQTWAEKIVQEGNVLCGNSLSRLLCYYVNFIDSSDIPFILPIYLQLNNLVDLTAKWKTTDLLLNIAFWESTHELHMSLFGLNPSYFLDHLLDIGSAFLSISIDDSITLLLRQIRLKALNFNLEKTPHELRDMFRTANPNCIENLLHALDEAGDYDFQTGLIEAVFRLTSSSERNRFVTTWFPNLKYVVQHLFVRIIDFDPDCRKFLNAFNNELGIRRKVFTFPCVQAKLGNFILHKPNIPTYEHLWVDFNIGSGSISLLFDRTGIVASSSSRLWETIIIYNHEVETVVLTSVIHGNSLLLNLGRDPVDLLASALPESICSLLNREFLIELGANIPNLESLCYTLYEHKLRVKRQGVLTPRKETKSSQKSSVTIISIKESKNNQYDINLQVSQQHSHYSGESSPSQSVDDKEFKSSKTSPLECVQENTFGMDTEVESQISREMICVEPERPSSSSSPHNSEQKNFMVVNRSSPVAEPETFTPSVVSDKARKSDSSSSSKRYFANENLSNEIVTMYPTIPFGTSSNLSSSRTSESKSKLKVVINSKEKKKKKYAKDSRENVVTGTFISDSLDVQVGSQIENEEYIPTRVTKTQEIQSVSIDSEDEIIPSSFTGEEPNRTTLTVEPNHHHLALSSSKAPLAEKKLKKIIEESEDIEELPADDLSFKESCNESETKFKEGSQKDEIKNEELVERPVGGSTGEFKIDSQYRQLESAEKGSETQIKQIEDQNFTNVDTIDKCTRDLDAIEKCIRDMDGIEERMRDDIVTDKYIKETAVTEEYIRHLLITDERTEDVIASNEQAQDVITDEHLLNMLTDGASQNKTDKTDVTEAVKVDSLNNALIDAEDPFQEHKAKEATVESQDTEKRENELLVDTNFEAETYVETLRSETPEKWYSEGKTDLIISFPRKSVGEDIATKDESRGTARTNVNVEEGGGGGGGGGGGKDVSNEEEKKETKSVEGSILIEKSAVNLLEEMQDATTFVNLVNEFEEKILTSRQDPNDFSLHDGKGPVNEETIPEIEKPGDPKTVKLVSPFPFLAKYPIKVKVVKSRRKKIDSGEDKLIMLGERENHEVYDKEAKTGQLTVEDAVTTMSNSNVDDTTLAAETGTCSKVDFNAEGKAVTPFKSHALHLTPGKSPSKALVSTLKILAEYPVKAVGLKTPQRSIRTYDDSSSSSKTGSKKKKISPFKKISLPDHYNTNVTPTNLSKSGERKSNSKKKLFDTQQSIMLEDSPPGDDEPMEVREIENQSVRGKELSGSNYNDLRSNNICMDSNNNNNNNNFSQASQDSDSLKFFKTKRRDRQINSSSVDDTEEAINLSTRKKRKTIYDVNRTIESKEQNVNLSSSALCKTVYSDFGFSDSSDSIDWLKRNRKKPIKVVKRTYPGKKQKQKRNYIRGTSDSDDWVPFRVKKKKVHRSPRPYTNDDSTSGPDGLRLFKALKPRKLVNDYSQPVKKFFTRSAAKKKVNEENRTLHSSDKYASEKRLSANLKKKTDQKEEVERSPVKRKFSSFLDTLETIISSPEVLRDTSLTQPSSFDETTQVNDFRLVAQKKSEKSERNISSFNLGEVQTLIHSETSAEIHSDKDGNHGNITKRAEVGKMKEILETILPKNSMENRSSRTDTNTPNPPNNTPVLKENESSPYPCIIFETPEEIEVESSQPIRRNHRSSSSRFGYVSEVNHAYRNLNGRSKDSLQTVKYTLRSPPNFGEGIDPKLNFGTNANEANEFSSDYDHVPVTFLIPSRPNSDFSSSEGEDSSLSTKGMSEGREITWETANDESSFSNKSTTSTNSNAGKKSSRGKESLGKIKSLSPLVPTSLKIPLSQSQESGRDFHPPSLRGELRSQFAASLTAKVGERFPTTSSPLEALSLSQPGLQRETESNLKDLVSSVANYISYSLTPPSASSKTSLQTPLKAVPRSLFGKSTEKHTGSATSTQESDDLVSVPSSTLRLLKDEANAMGEELLKASRR